MAIKGGNSLFKVEVTGDKSAIIAKVTFQDGEAIEREYPLGLNGEADPLALDCAMFGLETKVRNTIGAVKAELRTLEGAKERAKDLFAAHDEAEWNVGRSADGEAAPTGGIVARAVAEVLGRDLATVVAHVRSQFASIEDDKERAKATRAGWAALEVDPKFAPTVERLRAEAKALRAAKNPTVSTASLLAGL